MRVTIHTEIECPGMHIAFFLPRSVLIGAERRPCPPLPLAGPLLMEVSPSLPPSGPSPSSDAPEAPHLSNAAIPGTATSEMGLHQFRNLLGFRCMSWTFSAILGLAAVRITVLSSRLKVLCELFVSSSRCTLSSHSTIPVCGLPILTLCASLIRS